jgi:hypothetical protein
MCVLLRQALKGMVCASLLFSWGEARGGAPDAGNLLAQRGVLRLSAATPQPSGWIGIATDFQYFKADGFLSKDQSHSRMVNSYALNWAPFRFLEAAFALHVTSDSNGAGPNEELQVAVGDPELALKGGVALPRGFSVGGLLDLRFLSGAGFFQSAGSATYVYFAALGSWFGGDRLPLGVHLNFGFFRDGSEHLFDKPSGLTAAQLYSAQVSSFHRLVTRVAVEVLTAYVGPFVELSLEPYVGEGAPGLGKSPGVLSLGVRGWPTRRKGLQLLAALDVGLTGVGDGSPIASGGKFAYAIPRWNLLLQASYRFDAFAEPPSSTARTDGARGVGGEPSLSSSGARSGVIRGTVLDGRTERALWNARVTVEGEGTSALAVNPADGTFRTYPLRVGKHVVVATAEGYSPSRVTVEVTPEGAETRIKLAPRASIVAGVLRGTIKALSGKLSGATVLIPEIDRTIQVGEDGVFSVELQPGEYKIIVSARRFRTQTKSIRIQEGSTVILNVDLHR